MGHWIDLIFTPPPVPPITLPLAARMVPGARKAFAQAFAEALKLAYHRGIYDGLVAGVLITLLFVPILRRGQQNKGAGR